MAHRRQESYSLDEGFDEKLWSSDPPPDKGKGPWLYLFGCYTLEGAVWGLALSWGVFQNYYSKSPQFQSQSASLPVVGTCAAALTYFGIPVVTPVLQQHPRLMLPSLWLGWIMCLSALVLASFATKVWHLILTQGMLFGTGWAVCHVPFLIWLNTWFVKRRGTAYGILFGSSGLFAMILPFALEAGLKRYGFRITLRLTALGILFISGPCMLLIKPRTKISGQQSTCRRRSELYVAISKKPLFWIFAVGALLQGVAWFLPRFFIPSYAADLGLTRESGAMLLAAFGVAQVTGQMLLGWSSDKMNVHVPVTLSTAVPALSTLLLWAPAQKIMPDHVMIPLTAFAMLYAGFGGGYTVLWIRIGRVIVEDDDSVMLIYGAFAIMRGLSNVIAGPVSALLLRDNIDLNDLGLGRYKGIALFVGVGMAVSALAVVGACLGSQQNGLHDGKETLRDTEMEPCVSSLSDEDKDV